MFATKDAFFLCFKIIKAHHDAANVALVGKMLPFVGNCVPKKPPPSAHRARPCCHLEPKFCHCFALEEAFENANFEPLYGQAGMYDACWTLRGKGKFAWNGRARGWVLNYSH